MDQVREVLRYHHYALQTERTYCRWIVRYLKQHEYQVHPREMGVTEIEAFLSHLASRERVSASTQRQALNAIVFLYRDVLFVPLEREIVPIRAKTGRRPPTVMTQAEVTAFLDQLLGTHRLMAELLYGAGMRLMECVRFRVKDIDFGQKHIVVRSGKGDKDRVTVLPAPLVPKLQRQLERVRELHEADLAEGFGEVYLPGALGRKFPKAGRELVAAFGSKDFPVLLEVLQSLADGDGSDATVLTLMALTNRWPFLGLNPCHTKVNQR